MYIDNIVKLQSNSMGNHGRISIWLRLCQGTASLPPYLEF